VVSVKLQSVSQCVTVSVICILELVAVGKVFIVGHRGVTAGRCMSWGWGWGGSQHSRSGGGGRCGLGTGQDCNGNGRSSGNMNGVGNAKNL